MIVPDGLAFRPSERAGIDDQTDTDPREAAYRALARAMTKRPTTKRPDEGTTERPR